MDALEARGSALQRATSLYDLISGEAAAGERLGRLTDPVASALLGNQMLAIFDAPRDGGLGGSWRDFYDVVEVVARADGSTGWCVSVCNAINHTLRLGLPAEGREEVFGSGPTSCWASLIPRATATPEAGGFRVSCPGSFGSGSSISNWVMVAANAGGAGDGRYRAFVIHKAEVEIKPGSWDVMGLRGTASVDYTITDVFVPARRSWEYNWTSDDASGALSALAAARLNAIGLTAFASGVAQRALLELIASAGKTRRTVAEGLQAEDNVVQAGIGELDGRMKAARSHLIGLVSAAQERTTEGGVLTSQEGLDLSQACLTLAKASRDMVVFAFDHVGTSAVYAHQPMQRCLRDIFTGLKHVAFTPAFLGLIGRQQLGLPSARTVL
jgi:alkylation response protein AidB-like acyl-CoA dehydrogenase